MALKAEVAFEIGAKSYTQLILLIESLKEDFREQVKRSLFKENSKHKILNGAHLFYYDTLIWNPKIYSDQNLIINFIKTHSNDCCFICIFGGENVTEIGISTEFCLERIIIISHSQMGTDANSNSDT